MKLFEYEGKRLFREVGIVVPVGVVVEREVETVNELIGELVNENNRADRFVVKAQVLSGKRGKRGLVRVVEGRELISELVNEFIGKEVDGERVGKVLVEEAVDIAQELFVSITYSTKTRGPVLLFSTAGGVEVEAEEMVEEIMLEMGKDVPDFSYKLQATPLRQGFEGQASNKLQTDERQVELIQAKVWQTVNKLWQLFQDKDLFLAEINPLVITVEGQVVALDAKVVTDDAANFRQDWGLPERNMMGTAKSWAELEAEKIDKEDHRGAVGRVYLDLPGDIGVIAAGGGASLVAMDALVSYGLKPANYTEFSGNPPEWKVKRLTEIVLAKDNLRGAILIGGKANFTDQVETLSGFLDALKEVKPQYPIIVRRDGPRMAEAKAMLETAAKDYGWKLEVYDSNVSIIEAVKRLVDLVRSK